MALKDKYETVLWKKEEGIAWVTLNRPEKRNAMSPQLCFDMREVLTELNTDPDVRVLILTGAGDAFTAGMDLKQFFRENDNRPYERQVARDADRQWNWYKLSNFSKPTIAMVNGYCFGGGFTPLCACDFAIAADDAVFGLSEVNWGILPGGLVSKVVADYLPLRQAIYYAVTGRTFDGKTAERIGLVTMSVPRDKLREETVALAKDLMNKSPEVLKATKDAIKNVRAMPVDMAYEYLEAKSEQMRFRDTQNTRSRGMEEFLDKKTYRPGFQPVPKG
ncbi:MAG: p-hydroxycinnamoyl CoA hydratase/lyase [Rhodospirillales bacterium]